MKSDYRARSQIFFVHCRVLYGSMPQKKDGEPELKNFIVPRNCIVRIYTPIGRSTFIE